MFAFEKRGRAGKGQERGSSILGSSSTDLAPSTQNPVLSTCWRNETCEGMSSPETSTEMAAVMTLRVTNTKSKVVIVHLEEGRHRCYLEVGLRVM